MQRLKSRFQKELILRYGFMLMTQIVLESAACIGTSSVIVLMMHELT